MATTPAARPGEMPPLMRQMQGAIYGLFRTQALSVAASLGIADVLAKGPAGVEALAEATASHQRSLGRLMRFLVGEGVFAQDADKRFVLTPLGDVLRSDASMTARNAAIFYGSPEIWAAWGSLGDVVRTGKSGFELVHGEPLFDYAAKQDDFALVFNNFMSEMARPRISSASFDYSGFKTLVDVGGGEGTTLAAILGSYPALNAILFDLSAVVERAPMVLSAAGVDDRCHIVSGDFFESIPEGGDAYLLSNILHDWDDDHCAQILANCRKAMTRGARMIIVEAIVPDELNQASSADMQMIPVMFVDLQMMVVAGGVQRTAIEFRVLLESAGLGDINVLPGGLEATAL